MRSKRYNTFWKNSISICLVFAFFILYADNAFAQSEIGHINNVNLFVKDSTSKSCFRIPALVTAPNGDLIAAVDERISSCADLRGNRDINIVIRRSSNNGKTWSPLQTVVDYPIGKSASDPSMIVDKITKEIFMFFNFMDVDNEKDVYYFKYTISKDNGKSWSAPKDITSQISKPGWHHDFQFITSGRGIQTSQGKLLHTLVNLKEGVFLFESVNHGKNWRLIETPIKPGDESKVVELYDGSLMVNSRVNKGGFRYIHTSSDEGKSWTSFPDSLLADPGCNAGIIRYTSIKKGSNKNRLLFSNVNSKDKRENLAVRISYDEGKTWSPGKTIYQGSAAYSSMTILKNGDIGILFEKDNYSNISFVSFSLGWLTNGQDKR